MELGKLLGERRCLNFGFLLLKVSGVSELSQLTNLTMKVHMNRLWKTAVKFSIHRWAKPSFAYHCKLSEEDEI